MEKSRLVPLFPSSCIHLVPPLEPQGHWEEEADADPTRPLGLPQYGMLSRTDSILGLEERRESLGRTPVSGVDPATVLRELFELLEDYSPVWYTEENHDRAVAALKTANRW